eukprot:752766-Hanusia_phi.AAC.2
MREGEEEKVKCSKMLECCSAGRQDGADENFLNLWVQKLVNEQEIVLFIRSDSNVRSPRQSWRSQSTASTLGVLRTRSKLGRAASGRGQVCARA